MLSTMRVDEPSPIAVPAIAADDLAERRALLGQRLSGVAA